MRWPSPSPIFRVGHIIRVLDGRWRDQLRQQERQCALRRLPRCRGMLGAYHHDKVRDAMSDILDRMSLKDMIVFAEYPTATSNVPDLTIALPER